MTIGQRIKEARKVAGLTQRELAEKAGTATGTIQQYELGKRQPRIEQLRRIACALSTSWVDLAGDMSFDFLVGKSAAKRIQGEVATEEAVLDLLRNLYGEVEVKEVLGSYASSYYCLVGREGNQFVLYAENMDALKKLALSTISIMVEQLKDVRPEAEIIDEMKKDLSSEETRQAMNTAMEEHNKKFPEYAEFFQPVPPPETPPQSPPEPQEDTTPPTDAPGAAQEGE